MQGAKQQPKQQPQTPPPQKVQQPKQQQGCEVDRLMAMFHTL